MATDELIEGLLSACSLVICYYFAVLLRAIAGRKGNGFSVLPATACCCLRVSRALAGPGLLLLLLLLFLLLANILCRP
jgi:hypothetical protein